MPLEIVLFRYFVVVLMWLLLLYVLCNFMGYGRMIMERKDGECEIWQWKRFKIGGWLENSAEQKNLPRQTYLKENDRKKI